MAVINFVSLLFPWFLASPYGKRADLFHSMRIQECGMLATGLATWLFDLTLQLICVLLLDVLF